MIMIIMICKISHSGGMKGHPSPNPMIFFEPLLISKRMPTMSPSLKNEAPPPQPKSKLPSPLKSETPFQKLIPSKNP